MFGIGYKGNAHEFLCNLAASILEKQKYDVEFEKTIKIEKGGPQLRYEVDVYGTRGDDVLMYECGDCSEIKLEWLRKNVGTVIHMPYLDKWFSRIRTWQLSDKERQRVTERLSNRTW